MEHALSTRPEPTLDNRDLESDPKRDTKDQVYAAGSAVASQRLRALASGKRVGEWNRPELHIRPEDIGRKIPLDCANVMALCRDTALLIDGYRQPRSHPVTETVIADAVASVQRIQAELGAVRR